MHKTMGNRTWFRQCPKTRLLWSSEHGPRGGDEGNIIRAGHNYGWPLASLGVDYDGRPLRYAAQYGIEFDPANLTPATIDFTPSPGVGAIVFYRGQAFPKWRHDIQFICWHPTPMIF